MKRKRILVISSWKFSGITASLTAALARSGCEVLEGESNLKLLRFRFAYVIYIILNALLVYRTKYKKYLNRTYASFVAKSKSNANLVNTHSDVDAVLLIGANSLNFWGKKREGVLYGVFTDHTNMLSKKLPCHGYKIPEKGVYGRWNELEKHVLTQQDHVFVMGSHVKKSMVEDYGVDAAKVTVVGGGANLDLDIERDGVHKNYTGKNILFVGMDYERKGLNVLVKAFDRALRIFPDTKLHIVGAQGEDRDGIKYYGRLGGDALKSLFYKAQIFALPTYREPFGIVFLEAMFAKAVCIGTNIEAIPEIVLDGETGLLTEPGDVDGLAEKIVYLLSHTATLKRMAEAGYTVAKANWTWDIVAAKILGKIGSDVQYERVAYAELKEPNRERFIRTG